MAINLFKNFWLILIFYYYVWNGTEIILYESNFDFSDSEDDDDDDEPEADFAEALTADETLRLAENWTRRHSRGRHDSTEKQDVMCEDGLKDDEESGSCHDSDDSREHFSYQEYDSEGKSALLWSAGNSYLLLCFVYYDTMSIVRIWA